ncbi:peptidoglycan-binding domain-containing protein [Streptomyces sp. V2I9]|uniref:peptidoglycan-binding domain-containing protein n=1 Tax=Streptomyces sp. V2I9 TaxID=3042304 RepID=UPI00278B8DD4|nr:peptidoglycan-binding domain-containing protein [Streptomyces sp. V2I9]MDQ0984201.1 hypothetical protein [Streptomyces sp. V2I9]
MTGHACPECGRRTAGEPGTEHRMPCRCGTDAGPARPTRDEQRAAHEDHRAARTAEIAAAEDFDPLRIRPYVTLTDAGTNSEESGAFGSAEAAAGAYGDGGGYGVAGAHGASGVTEPYGGAEGHGTPSPFAAYEAFGAYGPGSPEPGGGEPASPLDAPGAATTMPLHLTGGPDRGASAGPASVSGPDPVQPRRRRPFVALAAGAAVAAVVGTAAFAGGLFGGADDSADEALPEITTSAPDTGDEPAASVAPSPSGTAAPSRTPPASATPSASPSASASPTQSKKPTPAASASASVPPGASASPAPDGGPPARTPTAEPPPAAIAGATLRPGDQGPQVAELQNRLREIGPWLYSGPSDGNYTDRVAYSVAFYQSYMDVQGDPTGVYGPNTRRLLEGQTSGHGRGSH